MPSALTQKAKALSKEALEAAIAPGADKLSATVLGQAADEWWAVKQARLEADKVSANLKARENLLQAAIIEQCRLQEISGVGGKTIRVGLEKDDQPTVKDWPKFYEYILQTKDFSLLEKRPGKAAVKERWEDGVQVPGVEAFPVYKLSKQGVR